MQLELLILFDLTLKSQNRKYLGKWNLVLFSVGVFACINYPPSQTVDCWTFQYMCNLKFSFFSDKLFSLEFGSCLHSLVFLWKFIGVFFLCSAWKSTSFIIIKCSSWGDWGRWQKIINGVSLKVLEGCQQVRQSVEQSCSLSRKCCFWSILLACIPAKQGWKE